MFKKNSVSNPILKLLMKLTPGTGTQANYKRDRDTTYVLVCDKPTLT